MVTVIGVRFRHLGKVYYFSPGAVEIEKGDRVVVETSRGVEYGLVVSDPKLAGDEDVVPPLRTIIRKADEQDKKVYEKNLELEKAAIPICQEKIEKHQLEMKLIDAEYTFDGNKILFYFTAEGRVDFRELVKDLASVFHRRIELRQIGVRDETKMQCGIGICGRPFCCSSFLSDFAPVSIKMAKDQGLSLNPSKISGTCGRLMCCLKYEETTYEGINRKLPSEGDTVQTPDGVGEVQHVNVLRQLIKVGIKETEQDDVDIREYSADDVQIVRRKHHKDKTQPEDPEMDAEEVKLLSELEKESEKEQPSEGKKRPRRNVQQHRRPAEKNKKYKDDKA